MKLPPDPHYRHRFPAEIISHAVWLYHVFSLSLRDVELLLAERADLWNLNTEENYHERKIAPRDKSRRDLLLDSATVDAVERPSP